ncbi:hypothetical protein [Longimicrobium sp.]|jgi:hypothetical protein|uniref:hypothetical protein n=1 Tax=Longimicrobium sp. TaxID=2029185 RepID=UPI002F94ABC5
MYTLRTTLRFALLAALAGAAASCADSPAAPPAPAASLARFSGASPLECPVATATSATATIGALGGVLEAGGHRVVIPANAVLFPTSFTMTVPASRYVEVDVKAAGLEHFEFLQPVVLSLSYARCTRTDIDRESLRIYYVDSDTRAILEDKGGVDNKLTRTVTTVTDHFSGYLIGQGRSGDSGADGSN